MKICYIYREKEKNEHSIEAVFDTIAQNIDNSQFSIIKWYKPISWIKTIKQIYSLRKQKYDCYHITGDVYYLWILFPFRKTVMTVHDIGMYKNHHWTLKRWLFVFIGIVLPSLLHKIIICVSELTKADLHNILKIPHSKLLTINNPLSLGLSSHQKEFNDTEPTILQIGSGFHKNLDNLIKSVEGVPCILDIIGQPDDKLIDEMKRRKIKYKLSHHISNEELIDHYNQSDILYFVSRSEGFGLPILEAQSVGRPVITSREEPMKSVAAEGALFADPEDADSIKKCIVKLCSSPELRATLIEKGYKNVNKYTPQIIAKEYQNLYKSYFE